ncbi:MULTISPECIES: hypothetical protein [unclassified Streptomyces]|uniref:hypothetical protein n=1 Tax=unclassified Streptomyces TaxID=2593676 RepID=UPI00081DC9F8|nr:MULTISPECIES: hypothetical protein [unclassified Streptomyces]MYR30573.1 hypothetical protein [Streptomyces sp. SID4945]SCF50151.1 hypothetical protein GA0115257_124112 [Streptomyces sp. LcepLS]
MTPRQAAWVRAHAWSPAARREHEGPRSTLLHPTGCELRFVSAVCGGGPHCLSDPGDEYSACDGGRTLLAETRVLGADGRRYGLVWPARPCRVRCICPCHTAVGLQHTLDDLT